MIQKVERPQELKPEMLSSAPSDLPTVIVARPEVGVISPRATEPAYAIMPPVSKDTGPPQQRMPSPQNTKEQYFAEGDRYAQAGRYRQAIKSYGQAVALEGKDVMGCVEQGNASYYSRDYEKAIAYYDRAITLGLVASNDHAWIYAQRGDAYLMLNDHRMAMRDFDQALKIDPEFRWARVRVEKAKPT